MSRKHSGLSLSSEELEATSRIFILHYRMGLRTGWRLKDLWMLNQLQRSKDFENITPQKSLEWYQKNFLGNQYEKYR